MKTSYQLVKQYLPLSCDPVDLASKLTQQGLEVDDVTPYTTGMEQYRIAEVISKEPHPNAENLWVCYIESGLSEHLQVVCGDPSVAIHDKVILAPIGTTLPNGKEIQKTNIRDIESHGMLCSSIELKLFDSPGLWILPHDAPVGRSLLEYLPELSDTLYNISPTPNRGDCLGTLGIAREVAVIEGISARNVSSPKRKIYTISNDIEAPKVNIEDQDCERYVTRIIKGVIVQESPLWLKIALSKYGLNSINNIVDISNYVMMELGQPIHIYDMDTLSLPIYVRRSQAEEELRLLNNQLITLPQDSLVIADKKRPIGLAGIMGGKGSSIKPTTTNILLEVAHFAPSRIQETAKKVRIQSDASYRYIRGVDIKNFHEMMNYLTALLLEVTTGSIGPVADVFPHPSETVTIDLAHSFIEDKLGFPIEISNIQHILDLLDFNTKTKDGIYHIMIPSYRHDCRIPVDIVEEILRIYGYDNIPLKVPSVNLSSELRIASKPLRFSVKELLVSVGLQEIYTYPLGKTSYQEFSVPNRPCIVLQNPLGVDLSVLRNSLGFSVLSYLQDIAQKGCKTLHGFEMGTVFFKQDNEPTEEFHLCLFQMGEKAPFNFKQKPGLVDFYATKDLLENLFYQLGISEDILFTSKDVPEDSILHPFRSADILYQEVHIGFIGEIHPDFWSHYKGKNNLIFAEINLSFLEQRQIIPIQGERTYAPISRYPKIERDLAFVLDKGIPAYDILSYIQELSPIITSVKIVDAYESEKLGAQHRSLSFKIVFQDQHKTLEEQDIQPLIENIIEWVKENKQGILREF